MSSRFHPSLSYGGPRSSTDRALPRHSSSSPFWSLRALSLRALSLRALSLRALSLRALSLRALSLRALCALACMLFSACGREDTPPSNPQAPPGPSKKLDTKVLETGAEALQELAPIRAFDHYLDGFHVMKDDPTLHMEAHHYCRGMNEEFTQCVIFDGNTQASNVIGVEYIISEGLFESLPPEEKEHWHPHNYEILSGQLILPGVPDAAEKAALAKKINSYGKTWHIWDTGHAGHPAAHDLPIGKPLLAWSYNRDGEAPAKLVAARDRRMQVSTQEKREDRADLAASAKPQSGVDVLRDKLHGTAAPPGVQAK